MTIAIWLLGIVLFLFLFFRLLVHMISRNSRLPNTVNPESTGLEYSDLSIPTENGKMLHAWHLKNKGASPALILIMHGWGRNAARMLDCVNELFQDGYDILAPDARNHGESDGDFYSSVKMFKEDILSCVRYAKTQLMTPEQKLFILGHSIGGSGSILATAESADVDALATTGAFSDPETIITRSLRQIGMPRFPVIQMMLWYIQKKLGVSFEEIRPERAIQTIKVPVLLVHGQQDKVVPYSEFQRLENACTSCRTLVYPQAGHSDIRHIPSFFPDLKSFYKACL